MSVGTSKIELLLAAKDEASPTILKLADVLRGTDKAAGGASESMGEAGQAAGGLKDHFGRLLAAAAPIGSKLQEVFGRGRDALVELGSVDIGKAVGGWLSSVGKTEVSFRDLYQIAGDLFQALGSVAGALGESLKRAAEDGDKGAQALLGGFERLQTAADGITSAFMRDFAPAILPVVQLFGDLAKQVADWSEKSGAGKTVAKGLIDVILVLGTAFAGTMQLIINTLIKVAEVAADTASAFSDDLANDIDVGVNGLRNFGKTWEKTSAGILDQLALVSAGHKALTQAEMDELAKRSEAGGKAADEAQKRHEDELKRIDEQVQKVEEGVLRRGEQEEKLRETMKERHEAAMEAIGELDEKEMEAFNQHLERIESQSETEGELKQQIIAYLEEVAAAETTSTEVRMEAQKRLAANARASATQMAADAKKAAQEQQQAAQQTQVKVAAAYQKMFSIITTAVTDWKSAVGQVLDLVTRQFLDSMNKQASATTSATTTIVGATNTQTGAFAGAQASASTAAIATIPPKVTSWAASLGPIGIGIATALIGAFIALARKKVGFEEGGSPVDRISRLVEGFGRRDMVSALLTPREFVVRQESAAPPRNKAFLDDFNQSGDVAGAAARAGFGAPGNGPLELIVRIVPDYDMTPSDKQLIREIVRHQNIYVTDGGGKVYATHTYSKSKGGGRRR